MRRITKIIMGIALVVLVVWDIIAYVWGKDATISVIITDWSFYSPWVPFVFGVLMGHFFVPARGSE